MRCEFSGSYPGLLQIYPDTESERLLLHHFIHNRTSMSIAGVTFSNGGLCNVSLRPAEVMVKPTKAAKEK